mmetsp:Transcript_30684/g.76318  ORF Transcript_30684/g.76318 Transcript_30684/m.76318 type:complete len:173 (+) Transcript_30684:928-1446(+)
MLLAPKDKAGAAPVYTVMEVAELTAQAIIEEITTVAGGAGTVPELAAAVEAFLAKPSAAAVKAAEKIVAGLPMSEQPTGAYYAKVMIKITAKGKDFPSTEAARLVRMVEGGSLRAEKEEFRYRINALRVFDPSIPKPPAPAEAADAGGDEEAPDDVADYAADAAAADDKTEL